MLESPAGSASSTTTKTVEDSTTAPMDKDSLIPPAYEVVAATSVALEGAGGFPQGSADTTVVTSASSVELDLDEGPKQPPHATSTVEDTHNEVYLTSGPTIDVEGDAVQQELEGRSDCTSTSATSKSPEEEALCANIARDHRDRDNVGSIDALSPEEGKDNDATADVSKRDCDSAVIAVRSSAQVEESNAHDNEEEVSGGKRVVGEVGPTTMLQLAEKALVALYEVHDKFFSADKGEKERRLKAKAAEVMEALSREGNGRNIRERSRLSYFRGRALDAFSEFDPEAEKCLARAVKLNPSDPESWNALGHCYWKKPDLFAAKRCFLQALDKDRKAESLRQLSMLLRQLPGTEEERKGQFEESLRLAKEAVTQDMGSGDSWYVLGNAYVASFFSNSRGIEDLDRALQAYKKAEVNGGDGNPDLFFNRGQVLHYREDYPEAVRDYRVAQELDPSLPVGQALHSIETGVDRLAKLVEKKGGLKHKRLSQLIAPLRGDSAAIGLGSSHRLVMLRDLRLGSNSGVAVALKVVMPAGQNVQPPERFVVVDGNGECAVLSLFSVTREACEKIQCKDILVVKHPNLRTVSLRWSPSSSSASLPSSSSAAASASLPSSSLSSSRLRASARTTDGSVDTAGNVTGNVTGSISSATSDRVATEAGDRARPLAYPSIQADPATIVLNGESMKASFTPPVVRLANFDK